MIFLDVEDLLYIAARATGAPVQVRDIGLLESGAARPRASAFGADAYPTLHDKAAALLHSIVGNHALVDGNKPLGLAAVIAFYGLNGRRLAMINDEAYGLAIAAASGELVEVTEVAERLENSSEAH